MRFSPWLTLVSTLLLACGGRARDKPTEGAGGAAFGGAAFGGSAAFGGDANARGGMLGVGGDSANGGASGAASTWTLPQERVATWQNSRGTLCDPKLDVYPWSLWGDQNTLYVATTDDQSQSTLRANAGAGWATVPTAGLSFSNVSGVPGGPLLLFGGRRCGLSTLSGEATECISELPNIGTVMSAGAERTFALAANRLLHFNGSYLTAFGPPLPEPTSDWPLYQLWVGDDALVVAGFEGRVAIVDARGDRRDLSIPDGLDARSLWANGADDIWVGAELGRVAHYNGASWMLFKTGNCAPVSSLWGTKEALFVAGGGFFGRIRGGQIETIFDQPCFDIPNAAGSWEMVTFTELWGSSATAVFTVVEQQRYQQTLNGESLETGASYPECGMRRIYWFDGNALGPL